MGDRALIVGQIQGVMRNFLSQYDASTPIAPVRIVGDTPNSILDHSEYLNSINAIVQEVIDAVSTYRPNIQTRWVAISKFPGRHSFFVLDINNGDYGYESAHTCFTKIPVWILRLSRAPKIFRHQGQDQKLAEKLASLHNLHGRDPLPLFDEYTQLRAFASPRHLWS